MSAHGEGDTRRFVIRGASITGVALPLAFGFGYAAGGLSAAVGSAAVTAGCIAAGASVYAWRYLR